MKATNIAELTRGELLTNPQISSFEGFSYSPYKVKRGDLFIAIDRSEESIKIAIEMGAYGILIDEDFEVSDQEVAWIKVQNINMALMRLMRFQSSYKKIKFVAVSPLQENILRSMSLANNVLIMPKNPLDSFVEIMDAKNESYVFCGDELALRKVAPLYDNVFSQRNMINQKNGSIFVSSFIHENEYYQKVQISPIFIPSLNGILTYLKENNIDFSLENFKPIPNFEPIFIDTSVRPQPFGSTRRALIIESNEELFKYEARTLLKILPPNNLLICKHINSKSSMDANFLYTKESDLKELSSYEFRYALVLGDKELILEALTKIEEKKYPSLF
ncbi:MAG: hypothetical protein KGV58_00485 [Campylobacteraceae bacterium]|nr:hypothetical protein [Campylobacteraceae bacterium]